MDKKQKALHLKMEFFFRNVDIEFKFGMFLFVRPLVMAYGWVIPVNSVKELEGS